jgi:hypothetical protein
MMTRGVSTLEPADSCDAATDQQEEHQHNGQRVEIAYLFADLRQFVEDLLIEVKRLIFAHSYSPLWRFDKSVIDAAPLNHPKLSCFSVLILSDNNCVGSGFPGTLYEDTAILQLFTDDANAAAFHFITEPLPHCRKFAFAHRITFRRQ